MENSGRGECGFESLEVSIVSSADDECLGLSDGGQFRGIGWRAAVVGTDQQAAGWQEWKELLLAGALKVTGETELMSSVAEHGRETGWVVVAGRGWWSWNWRCEGVGSGLELQKLQIKGFELD